MDRDSVSRRTVLKGSAGTIALTGLAGCTGGGGNSDGGNASDGNSDGSGSANGGSTKSGGASGTVKIGVLQPLSGSLAYYGKQSLWGFVSGLAYKGNTKPIPKKKLQTGTESITVDDVTYKLIIRDTKLNTDTALSLAKSFVTDKNVDMLFGCTLSSTARKVVTQVVQQAGDVPIMLGPAASAGITSNSDTCGKNVFRASETTAMDARGGGTYVAKQTDISKVYLFGADYSFGKAVVNGYRTVLTNHGIEIVGEKLVPRGYSQWSGLLQNAAAAGAEGIVAGFTAKTLPTLFTAYLQGNYDYNVIGGIPTRIAISAIGKALQKVLGKSLSKKDLEGTGLGPFTTRYHWNQYDNKINRAFVDAYTKAYGVVPDLYTSGTFTEASAIVQAVHESGATTGQAISNALRGMTVTDTPKGKNAYVFQTYNNQARSPMTTVDFAPTQTKHWKPPIQPSKPIGTVPANAVTIPKDAKGMNCSL